MRIRRAAVVVAVVALVAFWTWALFFASKDSINMIGDEAWSQRAEQLCADAEAAREELADYRELDEGDRAALLTERAEIVDQATDIVEDTLDDVVSVTPTDDKGRAIVPQWEDDYRQYVADRRVYADRLRSGEDVPFSETAVDGIPISERIERFANDNRMPACAPPTDL